MEGASDLGPQEPGDGPFLARMRLHQSWYRATVLGLAHGEGPNAADRRPLGNMLTREDAARGSNFLDPAIFDVARRRVQTSAHLEPFRCLADLVSSQAFCFNLFGLMVEDTDLATTLLRTVLDDVRRVVEVHISHAPSPRSEYLGDRTAFDAFVGYERDDGARSFVGVTVALAEGFGYTATESARHQQLTRDGGSPWWPDCHDRLAAPEFNALWRGHLLVEALRRHPAEPYVDGRFAVVHHPGDSDTMLAVQGYRNCLREPATLADWRLDHLLDRWRSADVADRVRGWLERLATRYVELDRSADAFDARAAVTAYNGHGEDVAETTTRTAPAEV